MFEKCDDSFIKALVRLLQPQVLLCGDYAFKVYELGSTMYFIQNGSVQIVSDGEPQVIYCTLMQGSYFGELAMPKLNPNPNPNPNPKPNPNPNPNPKPNPNTNPNPNAANPNSNPRRARDAHLAAAHRERACALGLHSLLHDSGVLRGGHQGLPQVLRPHPRQGDYLLPYYLTTLLPYHHLTSY
jgi:hypothetical protein